MNADELFREIHEYCLSHINEDNIKKYSKYFKNGYDAYGLSQTQMSDKVKELLKRKDFGMNVLLEAAPMLIKTGKYEETTFALLLFGGLKKHFDRNAFKETEKWFEYGIYNWAHADTLGMFVLPGFILKSIVNTDDFKSWITSPYKFQRRCVPVTFIKLLKTEIDYTYLFDFIRPLMADPEREVHQGTGWFLKEAWKIKPEITEEFLLQWNNTSPRLIFQYACEKMTAENKLRFRKEKVNLNI